MIIKKYYTTSKKTLINSSAKALEYSQGWNPLKLEISDTNSIEEKNIFEKLN